jgi:SET domain-containing protein
MSLQATGLTILKTDMIEVRDSPIHGRGAFAAGPIRRGEAFHHAHLLAFGCEESAAVEATSMANYVFYIEDCPDHPECDKVGLAMSPMSFVNHRRPANAAFKVDRETLTISFTALADIAAGEELTIDYGDFAAKIGIGD